MRPLLGDEHEVDGSGATVFLATPPPLQPAQDRHPDPVDCESEHLGSVARRSGNYIEILRKSGTLSSRRSCIKSMCNIWASTFSSMAGLIWTKRKNLISESIWIPNSPHTEDCEVSVELSVEREDFFIRNFPQYIAGMCSIGPTSAYCSPSPHPERVGSLARSVESLLRSSPLGK